MLERENLKKLNHKDKKNENNKEWWENDKKKNSLEK